MNKYPQTLDGTEHGSYEITHNLNTTDVVISIYFGVQNELYKGDYRLFINSENTVGLYFNRPIRAQDLYRVVIIG